MLAEPIPDREISVVRVLSWSLLPEGVPHFQERHRGYEWARGWLVKLVKLASALRNQIFCTCLSLAYKLCSIIGEIEQADCRGKTSHFHSDKCYLIMHLFLTRTNFFRIPLPVCIIYRSSCSWAILSKFTRERG